MGDAEIIPIGTRGRPGRGTGSAAVVAPPAAWRRAGAKPAPRRAGAARPRPPPAGARRPAAEPEPAPPTADGRGPAGAPAHRRRERGPLGGIPAADWLAALPARRPRGLRRAVGAAAGRASWPSCAAG